MIGASRTMATRATKTFSASVSSWSIETAGARDDVRPRAWEENAISDIGRLRKLPGEAIPRLKRAEEPPPTRRGSVVKLKEFETLPSRHSATHPRVQSRHIATFAAVRFPD